MVAVEALQDDVFFVYFILALANRALFVFFAKIFKIGSVESGSG